MKMFIIPVSIIIVLISGIFINLFVLKNKTTSLAHLIEQAKIETQKDNFIESEKIIHQFIDEYKKDEPYFGVVIRHAELDSVRVLAQRVTELNTSETKAQFLAESAALMDMIDHLYKSEKFILGNVL